MRYLWKHPRLLFPENKFTSKLLKLEILENTYKTFSKHFPFSFHPFPAWKQIFLRSDSSIHKFRDISSTWYSRNVLPTSQTSGINHKGLLGHVMSNIISCIASNIPFRSSRPFIWKFIQNIFFLRKDFPFPLPPPSPPVFYPILGNN